MWELATNMSEVLGGLLLLTWAITGHRAGRLVLRPSRAKLRRSARLNLALLGLNLLVLLAQLVMVALTWTQGWVFVENRVVLAVPPMLVGAVAVQVWSVPRLWRLGRAALLDPAAPVGASDRSAASDPVLLGATALLWWRQRRRQRLLGGPEPPRRPGLGLRGLRALAGVVAVAAVLAGWVGYGLRASRLPERVTIR